MKNIFSPEIIEKLSQRRYVKSVTETSIVFTDEFKELFIDEYYNLGKKPTEIFLRAGFDPDIIGQKRISRCSENWRKAYRERGNVASGKEQKKLESELRDANDSLVKKNEEINSLKAEVELLKKALQIGRRRCKKRVYGNPDLVEMIDEVIEQYTLHNCIKRLCNDVGMRPQDYYYRKSDLCKNKLQ